MPALSTDTPFGTLTVLEEHDHIVALRWGGTAEGAATSLLQETVGQLQAYVAGELQTFDLPMKVHGSAFQRAVCDKMRDIRFGDTCTYGDIAKGLGKSAQAVGSACGANPIPILIPCHRVMGAGGKLTGFSGAGGVETKVALLRHEGAAGLLI